MQKAKRIFVFISGLLGFVLRVLFRESSRIPAFHRDLGMVGRGQSFLRANGGYPLIDRLFVYLLQFIELRVAIGVGCYGSLFSRSIVVPIHSRKINVFRNWTPQTAE